MATLGPSFGPSSDSVVSSTAPPVSAHTNTLTGGGGTTHTVYASAIPVPVVLTTKRHHPRATTTTDHNATTQSGDTTASHAIAATTLLADVGDNTATSVAQLKMELDAERSVSRQQYAEKERAVRAARDTERARASIALKDLRTRFHKEKQSLLESVKESLSRKHLAELTKLSRQHGAEIRQLQSELRAAKERLTSNDGGREAGAWSSDLPTAGTPLTHSGHTHTFAAERTKLVRDLHDLRVAKRKVEGQLVKMADNDRKKDQHIRNLYERNKVELTKMKRNTEIDVRKLLDEIKLKDRLIHKMEMELRTRAQLVNLPPLPAVMVTEPSAAASAAASARKDDVIVAKTTRTVSHDSLDTCSDVDDNSEAINVSVCSDATSGIESMVSSVDDSDEKQALVQQIEHLTGLVSAHKKDLESAQKKYKILDEKHQPMRDKLKAFLDQNISLTNKNRSLEEKLTILNKANKKMKQEVDEGKCSIEQLQAEIAKEQQKQEYLQAQVQELEQQREQQVQEQLAQLPDEQHAPGSSEQELQEQVQLLTQACQEKDKRISLIVGNQRKQRLNNVQQKKVRFLLPAKVRTMVCHLQETYYGSDSGIHTDIRSPPETSAVVTSSVESLECSADGEVTYPCFHGDIQFKYERLSSEHLRLQRLYSTLQAKVLQSYTSSDQLSLPSTSSADEIQILKDAIHKLKDTLRREDEEKCLLRERLNEMQERSEDLEFAMLELEESRDEPAETHKTEELAVDMGVELSMEHVYCQTEVLPLQSTAIQTIAMICNISSSCQTDLDAEKMKVADDNAQLLTSSNEKIETLQREVANLQQSVAVHEYTRDHDAKREDTYRKEIDSLRRQVTSLTEGKQAEAEYIHHGESRNKTALQQISRLEEENEAMRKELAACARGELTDMSSQTDIEEESSSSACSSSDEVEHLEEENSRLKSRISDQVQLITSLRSAASDQKRLIDTEHHTDRIKELEASERSLRTKLELVQQRELRAKDQLALVAEERARRIQVLQLQLQQLETTNEHLTATIDRLRDVEMSAEQSQDLHEIMQSYVAEIQELKEENADLVKELNELKAAISKHDETSGDVDNDDDILKRLKDLERKEVSLKREIDDKDKEIQELLDKVEKQNLVEIFEVDEGQRIQDLEEEVSKLKDEITNLREGNISSEELNDEYMEDLKRKIEKLEEQNERGLSTINQLTANESSMREKLKSTQDVNAQLEDALGEKEDKLQGIILEYEKLRESEAENKTKIQHMEQSEHATKEDLKIKIDEYHELQFAFSDLQKQAVEYKKQAEEHSAVIQQLRETESSLLDVELQAKTKEQTHLGKIADLEHKIADLEKYIASQTNEYEANAKREMERMDGLMRDCKDREEQLEEQLKTMTDREQYLNSKVELLEQTEDKLMEQIMQLEEQLGCASEKHEDLSTGEANKEREAEEATISKDKLKELSDLRIKVDLLLDSEETLMEKLKESESLNAHLNQETTELESDVKDMEILLTEKTNIISSLEQQLTDLKLGETQLVNSMADKISTIDALETEKKQFCREMFEKLEADMKSKESDLATLKEQNESLSNALEDDKKCIEDLQQQVVTLSDDKEELVRECHALKQQQTEYHVIAEDKAKCVKKLEKKMKEMKRDLNRKTELIEKLQGDADQLAAVDTTDLQHTIEELEYQLKELKESKTSLKQQLLDMKTRETDMNTAMLEKEKLELVLRNRLAEYEKTIKNLEDTEGLLRNRLADNKQQDSQMRTKVLEFESSEATMKQQISSLEGQNKDLLQVIRSMQQSMSDNDSYGRRSVSPARLPRDQDVDNVYRSRSLSPSKEAMLASMKSDHEMSQLSREEMTTRLEELKKTEQYQSAKIASLTKHLDTFRHAVKNVAVSMESDSASAAAALKKDLLSSEHELESQVRDLIKTEVQSKMKVVELNKEISLLKKQLENTTALLSQQSREHHVQIEKLEDEVDSTRRREARLKNKLQYGNTAEQDSAALNKIQHLERLVFDLEASERRLQNQIKSLKTSENLSRQRAICTKRHQEVNADEDYEKYQQVLQLLQSHHTVQQNSEINSLRQRVAELEKSEQSLKLKTVELSSYEASALDCPDSVLRRENRQLEDTERTLRNEILDLEQEKQRLYAYNKDNKDTIHEQSVKIRRLELEAEALREQIQHLEQQEGNLKERESLLVESLSQEKKKLESLNLSISKLELSVLEQKQQKSSTSAELTAEIQQLQQYVSSLEERNDHLVIKTRSLEEEKAELTYAMSESDVQRAESVSEKRVMKAQLEGLQSHLSGSRASCVQLQDKVKNEVEERRKAEEEVQQLRAHLDAMKQQMKDLEKASEELNVIKQQADELKYTISELERENSGIKEMLELYEFSNEHKQFANVPHRELKQLRAQARRLSEAEQEIAYLKHHRVEPLASCAHKAVQVYTASKLTLKGISPELKQALQQLGSEYPQAYRQFVHSLKPRPSDTEEDEEDSEPAMRIYSSHPTSAPGTHPTTSSRPPPASRTSSSSQRGRGGSRGTSAASYGAVRAAQAAAAAGGASGIVSTRPSVQDEKKRRAVKELADVLPPLDDVVMSSSASSRRCSDASSLDDMPVAGPPLSPSSPKRPIDGATEHEKKQLIGQLLDIMPSDDKNKTTDNMDDLTMSLNFSEETDSAPTSLLSPGAAPRNVYSSKVTVPSLPQPPQGGATVRDGAAPPSASPAAPSDSESSAGAASTASSAPPPLPFTAPPVHRYGMGPPAFRSFDSDTLCLPTKDGGAPGAAPGAADGKTKGRNVLQL